MYFHKGFLFIWIFELIVFPLLALFDLGLSFGINSNFYARFCYIAIFFLSIVYIFLIKGRIVIHPLIMVFFVVLIIGVLKGFWEGSLSNMTKFGFPVVLSHIFYVVMPIVMMSYGWFFFEDYKRSEHLQRILSKIMYFAFIFGLLVVVLFAIAFQLGFAAYDAIGLWNFIYSAPYFLYQPNGLAYFGVAVLATIIAAKRGVLVVFFAYFLLAYIVARGFRVVWVIVALILLITSYSIYMFSDVLSMDSIRLLRTVQSLQEGNLDEASAGRWIEAISALEYLNSQAKHMLLGAGFGAQFLPWPDQPDYSDYWSHYTHFGAVSYAWIGGFFLPVVVYAFLFGTGFALVLKMKRGLIERSHYHFVYWLWGIIAISMLGAVLMNNSFLWFVIGCCLNLNRRSADVSLNTRSVVNL